MKKKFLLTVTAVLFSLTSLSGQEQAEKFQLKNWDFFFTLGPVLYYNADDATNSAPSPVMFNAGIGFEFFNNKIIALQPKISYFTAYYLWDGENARPAEIENREALTFSVLVDLDASHTWYLKNSAIQAGAGISFLLRHAILANGVSADSAGNTPAQNAGADIKSLNSWFLEGTNFLYPNITLSWMHRLESNWHAGFEARFYIPLGAMTSGRKLDTSMATIAVKICNK